ncbi:MAG: antibiotic biosynthesis monooxygenase [Oscillospiraceae bacterium]|jgi:quinol monooxygenase YgiN|nr:antibiotic biosynthesis monooxygenase [Oscillospiraceae bacterium]
MSIRVVANNYVSAEKAPEYLALAKQIVAKTNELDAGCISYNLFHDTMDPEHYVMLEEWEDQASLDKHMQAAHFQELIPQMNALGTGKQGGIALLDNAF